MVKRIAVIGKNGKQRRDRLVVFRVNKDESELMDKCMEITKQPSFSRWVREFAIGLMRKQVEQGKGKK